MAALFWHVMRKYCFLGMHLPLPRASGNKNTPATATNLLGIINRNKKRQQNQQPPSRPRPTAPGEREQRAKIAGGGRWGLCTSSGWGCGGAAPTMPTPRAPQGAGGCRHHKSGRGVSEDGYLAPYGPLQGGNSDTQQIPLLLPWVQEAALRPSFGDRDKVRGGGPRP